MKDLDAEYDATLERVKTWTPENVEDVAREMVALADRQHPDATYFVAYWQMQTVKGFRRNDEAFKSLMIRGMKLGSKLALARCLQDGFSVPKDPERAVQILHELEKSLPPHPRVLGGLAYVYGAGAGCPRDEQRGKEYRRQAIALGDVTSMYALGLYRTYDFDMLVQAADYGHGPVRFAWSGSGRGEGFMGVVLGCAVSIISFVCVCVEPL